MLYTGLDLHRSFSYITTMSGKGKIVGQKKLPSNGDFKYLSQFWQPFQIAQYDEMCICVLASPVDY